MKYKKAPKGHKHSTPTTLKEIKTADLSKLTSAAQRKLLVSLNRESNKRLQSISKELTAKKLRPTILQENKEFFRIQRIGKRFGIGSRQRFTLKKNATKPEMESMIRERIQFLESKMTVTSDTEKRGQFLPDVKEGRAKNIREVYSAQKESLLKIYNTTFDKSNKRLSDEQFNRFGDLLNKARAHHLLGDNGELNKYVQDLAAVGKIRERKNYTINQVLDELEKAIDERIEKETRKSLTEQELLRQLALGGAIPA